MDTKAIVQSRCTVFVQVPEPGWVVGWVSEGQHLCCFSEVLKPCFVQNTLKTDQGHNSVANEAKSKVKHLRQGNPKHKYKLSREWIESHPEEKDMGVLVDENNMRRTM